MLVRRRSLDVRRRDRRHERLGGADALERRLERIEVGLELGLALVGDRAGADHECAPAPRTDLLGDGRLIIVGKVSRLARVGERARPRALAFLEAGEALCGIGDEARLAHLAVADDIEPGRGLLAHALRHRALHARRIGLFVDGLAVHAREHQLEQVVGARQAAHMGGQDTVSAQMHRLLFHSR